MSKFLIKLFLLFLVFSFSGTLKSEPKHIILTSSKGAGSFIFAKELVRLLFSSDKNRKSKFIISKEDSSENRLLQLASKRVSLAIIDAKTAHDKLKKYSSLRVLSVLWRNWLHILGTTPGKFLSLESTKTLLVHENSIHFAKVWKNLSPKTEISWFNSRIIPDFKDGFSQEVLAVTGPFPIVQINNWLEQFPGIRLLVIEDKLIQSLKSNNHWLREEILPAHSFSYQAEEIKSLTWRPVLVTNIDFPEELGLLILKTIFSQRKKLNPHLLFKKLQIEDNTYFKKIYSYHSSTKKLLDKK